MEISMSTATEVQENGGQPYSTSGGCAVETASGATSLEWSVCFGDVLQDTSDLQRHRRVVPAVLSFCSSAER